MHSAVFIAFLTLADSDGRCRRYGSDIPIFFRPKSRACEAAAVGRPMLVACDMLVTHRFSSRAHFIAVFRKFSVAAALTYFWSGYRIVWFLLHGHVAQGL